MLAQNRGNHYYKMDMDTLRTLPTADGTTLGYRLWRQGATPRRTIVLLHGMASNMTRWSEFIEQTTLKENWDILCPDLRGHGQSFTRDRLNMDSWCRDLLALLDAEGCDRAVLVGHSLGAQVAVHFAARHPARVRGLALIDPVFHQALRGTLRTVSLMRPVIKAACLRDSFAEPARPAPPADSRPRSEKNGRGHAREAARRRENRRRWSSSIPRRGRT